MGPQHRNIRQFQCRTFSGSFYIACPPVAPVEPDASATRRTDRSCDCTAFLPTWVVVPGLMISSDPSVEKSEGHFVWSPQWCSAAGTREPLGISPTGFRWFLDGFPCFSIKATIIQPLKINPLIPIELVISLMISPEAMLMVGFIYTHYLLISVISTIRDAYITSPIISPFWLVLYPDLHPDFS